MINNSSGKKLFFYLLLFIAVTAIAGCKSIPESLDNFIDSRDGQVYRTVTIKGKTWMLDNLNYNISGSYCYDNNKSNCSTFGRLYDWNDARKACPKGWRLPTYDELRNLVSYFGGIDKSGAKFTDAAPGGLEVNYFGGSRYFNGEFHGLKEYTVFWTSTEYDEDNSKIWCLQINDPDNPVATYQNLLKTAAFSVRCVKDY
jgi:uncharacterized protein (TIGR02145 family)